MQDELLSQAITKMRIKVKPKSIDNIAAEAPKVHVPEDAHKSIYPILEIYDESVNDPDVIDKAKFIHEFLTDEHGTARDKIMSILNELPAISNSSTLDRIWKYCRLKNEYRNTITRAEKLNQRIKAV